MSAKTDQAIAKITKEALEINNRFAVFIEEHLTNICTTDKVAEKLLAGKPLKEFCSNCRDMAEKEARKQGVGLQINGLPDTEYQKLAEEYYGITDADKSRTGGNVIDIMDLL